MHRDGGPHKHLVNESDNSNLRATDMNASTALAQQPWSLALIRTKMTPPSLPRGHVGREVLLSKMAAAIDRTLTVVIAPAGFGKTTLLAEWLDLLRAKRHLAAWLSLDSDDDNLQQFAAYVLAALSHGSDGVGQHATELLCNDPLAPGTMIISVLLNEIASCNRQVFLVLDDFHQVKSKPIQAAVSRLLRYAPENLHVVVGTRAEPCLALSQFQTRRKLLRVDVADLRFSAEDAQAFFAQAAGIQLDRPSVELLNNATEGWVAGLQLASLGLRAPDDASRVARDLAGSAFGVETYLNEAVLTQLPPPMLQFVLRTSVLDRLGPGVCDAVMGAGARSWDKLDWLERQNLFIRALDPDRQWFRFHALLSDALRQRAARQFPAELPALHRRASRWFAAAGLWSEAVRHALAGGEMEQAAAWVEDCATVLIDRGDVRTLLGWIAKLPEELVNSRLQLRLAKAWALVLTMRKDEANSAVRSLEADLARNRFQNSPTPGRDGATLPAELRALEASIEGLGDNSPRALELGREAAASELSMPLWARTHAESAQLFGLVYEGRFDEALRIKSKANVDTGHDRTLIYSNAYRTSMFGLCALVEGNLSEAIQLFESAFTRAECAIGSDSTVAALPAGYLAALHYERNDLARAQQMVHGRTGITMESCALGSLMRHCRTAACLYSRRGDIESALVILEEARKVAASRDWVRLRAGCDAEAVRLCLRDGRLAQAKQVANAFQAAMPAQQPSPMGSFIETWTSWCTMRARLGIAADQPEKAAQLLEDLRGKLAATGTRYLEAGASLLLALAYEAASAHEAALEVLGSVLRYALPNAMINSFVDEGEPMRSLLRRYRSDRADIDKDFVDRLLAAFDVGSAQESTLDATPARPPLDLLTAREIEILDHISRGLSNKEIGRALRVAPETIKWHLKNIFEKLNVGSRVEAVQSGLGMVRASHDRSGSAIAADAGRARPPAAGS